MNEVNDYKWHRRHAAERIRGGDTNKGGAHYEV